MSPFPFCELEIESAPATVWLGAGVGVEVIETGVDVAAVGVEAGDEFGADCVGVDVVVVGAGVVVVGVVAVVVGVVVFGAAAFSAGISLRMRFAAGWPGAAGADLKLTIRTACEWIATGLRFGFAAAGVTCEIVRLGTCSACAGLTAGFATGAASTGRGAVVASATTFWAPESGPSRRPGRSSRPATTTAVSAPVAA